MSNPELKEFPEQFCKVFDNHAPKYIKKNLLGQITLTSQKSSYKQKPSITLEINS